MRECHPSSRLEMEGPKVFDFTHRVRWSEVDANRHMRNTAFSEICIDARLSFLAMNGSGAELFDELQVGPVLMREDIRYRREVYLDEVVSVQLTAAGLSDDASHWSVKHHITKENGKTAAILVATGGWFDLKKRKLIVPPEPTADALRRLEPDREFEALPSLIRRYG